MSTDKARIMLLWLILRILFVSSAEGNQVDQSPFITATEKETAQIKCNHSITNDRNMYWYKHIKGRALVMVISGFNTESTNGRFHMAIDRNQRSTELSIESVEIQDLATYYCAVEPTVIQTERNPVHILQDVHTKQAPHFHFPA
ncbi:immunoglobulin iota chain-like [Pelobates cultripes]|nr:immunoglobulin iota chain-like [Pelobates cultripes]